MNYVDGFVAAVPFGNKEACLKHAAEMAQVAKKFGALSVVETWADDVPEGKRTSFTMAVKREENEAAIFSWIEGPSKEVCDQAWEKMMADPHMDPARSPMPSTGNGLSLAALRWC